MNPTKPDDLALFSAALSMPPAEREAFLAKACGDEPGRKESIIELLQAHDSSAGFMETPLAPKLKRERHAAAFELRSGDRVGNYELIKKIGEGGCGAVFLAQQHAPVRRQVALKVIKLGMDTQAVIARFEAEREALARMEHANIARVLDAGATSSGRPYFVMELVQGVAITEYCDLHRLDIGKRLRLFIQVCRAVEHAHQKGVIHRDLKPSNILVTLQDGEPVPKVIDFGVAKATQGRLADDTIFTAVEQFVGTPAYMSPEQADSGGRDIDTRTDIYSLGVLLYELLTGTTPFGPQIRHAPVDQVRRTIREVDPPVPSSRCAGLEKAEATLIAQRRSMSAGQLTTQLRGDLDWIAVKAMEKDRTRRYDTVSALSTDVLRHLQSEPILARPPSTAYRIQKLVMRHKVPVLAAAAVIIALISAAAVSTSRYIEERRARELAVAAKRAEAEERVRAQDAATRADQSRRDAEASQRQAEAHRTAAEQAKAAAETDRRSAEQARLVAERAQDTAEKAQARAEQSRQDALHAARDLKAHLYAADLYSVQNVLRSGGDLGQIQGILRRHIPADGDPEIRGLEWYYAWKLAQGDALFSWRTQQGLVRNMAVSPNGRLLATSGRGEPGEQGQVRVWDAHTHELKAVLTDTECAAFSPDSRTLITATRDARVHLWNTTTWREEGQFGIERLNTASSRRVELAVAGSGALLAVSAGGTHGDRRGTVAVWDWETRREVTRLEDAGFLVAFVGDGETLVTVGYGEGRIKVWNGRTGKLQRELGAIGFVSSFAVSPDGRRVAALVAGKRASLKVWSLGSLKLERSLDIDELDSGPGAVAFSPDGEWLAASGSDRRVRVWRTSDGRPVSDMKGSAGAIWSLAFSADGERLYSAGRSDQISAWPAAVSPKETETIATTLAPAKPNLDGVALRFSPGGRYLVAAEWERLLVLDTRSALPAGRRGGHHLPLWFSADAGSMLCLNQQRRTSTRNDPIAKPNFEIVLAEKAGDSPPPMESIDLLRLPDCAVQRTAPLLPQGDGVALTAASADGERVAVVWQGNSQVYVHDSSTGRVVRSFQPRSGVPQALAFSPDGRKLAIGGTKVLLEVWDLSADAPWIVAAHTMGITQLCFSADGAILATSSSDLTHKFWNVAERREAARMVGFEKAVEARFSPDGKTFWASTGAQLRLWHVPTQRDLGAFPAQGTVRHFAISPDQRAMAYTQDGKDGRQLVLVRIPEPRFDTEVRSSAPDAVGPARIRVAGAKPEYAVADADGDDFTVGAPVQEISRSP